MNTSAKKILCVFCNKKRDPHHMHPTASGVLMCGKCGAVPVVIKSERVAGRNKQCPCGSGKKYKKCCIV